MADTSDSIYAWPQWMPPPEQDNFSRLPVDTRTKSEMEAGTIERAEYDTDEQNYSCSMTLDPTEAKFLESFEHVVLRQGTTHFMFPCWIAGELQLQRCKFVDRPKATKIVGINTIYSFTLSVEQRDLWSLEVTTALTIYAPDDLNAWSDSLNLCLTTNLPGVTQLPELPWSSI